MTEPPAALSTRRCGTLSVVTTPHPRPIRPLRVTCTARFAQVATAVLLGSLFAALLGGCDAQPPSPPRTTTITVTSTPSVSPVTTTTPTTPPTTPATPATPTSAPTTPPTTFADAMARVTAGTVDPSIRTAFTSPTGNIFCAISGQGTGPVGCELKDGRVAQPTAGSCPSEGPQDVGRVEFLSNGPTPICNSDSIIRGNVPTLTYGSVGVADGSPIRCLSEKIGMTCIDTATQHGFFITRKIVTVF